MTTTSMTEITEDLRATVAELAGIPRAKAFWVTDETLLGQDLELCRYPGLEIKEFWEQVEDDLKIEIPENIRFMCGDMQNMTFKQLADVVKPIALARLAGSPRSSV